MKLMTAHILQARVAAVVEDVLREELAINAEEVLKRGDWSNHEILRCQNAIEREIMSMKKVMNARKDSVKGEIEMSVVYQYSDKATDIITLHNSVGLQLTECKYAIKVGGSGPFSSPESFCRNISDKFHKMTKVFNLDGEVVNPVRLLVVNDLQFPFSVAHIQALEQNNYPQGSFSHDGRIYKYVLCSTNMVRQLLFSSLPSAPMGDQHLIFSL